MKRIEAAKAVRAKTGCRLITAIAVLDFVSRDNEPALTQENVEDAIKLIERERTE